MMEQQKQGDSLHDAVKVLDTYCKVQTHSIKTLVIHCIKLSSHRIHFQTKQISIGQCGEFK